MANTRWQSVALFGTRAHPTLGSDSFAKSKILQSFGVRMTPLGGSEGRLHICHGELASHGENSDENFDCGIPMLSIELIKAHFSLRRVVE